MLQLFEGFSSTHEFGTMFYKEVRILKTPTGQWKVELVNLDGTVETTRLKNMGDEIIIK